MPTYRFSISLNGQFLFRTDWDDNQARVDRTCEDLVARFLKTDGYKVSIDRRETRLTGMDLS